MDAQNRKLKASRLDNSDVRAAVCQALRSGSSRAAALAVAGYKSGADHALKLCRARGYFELAGLLDGSDPTVMPDPNLGEIVVIRSGILLKSWKAVDQFIEFGGISPARASMARWAIERYEPKPEHLPEDDSDELWEHIYGLEQEGRNALEPDTDPE